MVDSIYGYITFVHSSKADPPYSFRHVGVYTKFDEINKKIENDSMAQLLIHTITSDTYHIKARITRCLDSSRKKIFTNFQFSVKNNWGNFY